MLKSLLVCAVILLCACSEPHVKLNEEAPELSARNTSGKLVKLKRSGVELVEFWQNGCVACLKVMDELEQYALEQNIAIYAINSIDSKELIKSHEAQKGFKAISFLQDNSAISWDRYEIFAVPTIFILKNGVVKEKILGDRGFSFIKAKIENVQNEA